MIKEMFEDVWKEVMLFFPVLVFCQTLALAGTVGTWAIMGFIGLHLSFLMVWKMMALLALVVALLALGQLKFKGIIP